MLVNLKDLITLDRQCFNDCVIGEEKEVWVYSYDENRKAVINKKIKIEIIGKNLEKYVDLIIDNDKIFNGLLNINILMIDGKYKNIKSISELDSVMPFCLSSWGQPIGYPAYSKKSLMQRYEHVYQPWYGAWESVHRLVLREKLGRPIRKKFICHHIDENYLNNNPDNLMEMTSLEHNKLNTKYLLSDEFKAKRVEASKKSCKKRWAIKEYREKQSEFMKKENAKRKDDMVYRKKLSDGVSKGRINMRNLRNNRTTEEEIELYKNALAINSTFKEAASSLNMHSNTLRRRLRSLGIIKPKVPIEELEYISEPNKTEERINYYVSIMKKYITIKNAAEALNIHPQTLSRRLKLYDIWNKMISLNNHKIVKIVEGQNISGIFAEIDVDYNIGLSCGVFVK